MFKPLSIAAVLFTITVSYAQTLQIKVVDNDNLQPIVGVYSYDSDGGIDSTDARGMVTLYGLKDNATVLLKHPLYKTRDLKYSFLIKKTTVPLEPIEEPTGKTALTTGRFDENKDPFADNALVLDKKNFKLYNPQTSSDVLATTGDIYIQKTGQGSGNPLVGGFSASSLLFTIDGVRMNNAIYRSGTLQNLISLDPNVLEKVVVVFGPGSTLYGSDAMGGVIHFHFTGPAIPPDSSIRANGSTMARFAGANSEKTGRVQFNFSWKNLGGFTAISLCGFDDLRMGNDTNPITFQPDKGGYYNVYKQKSDLQQNSGYKVFTILEKIRMAVNKDAVLNGSLYYSTTSPIPRYDKLIEPVNSGSSLKFSEWNYGPPRWFLGTIALDYTNPQPLFDAAKVILAYQNYEERCHVRARGSVELTDTTEITDAASATVDCSKPIGGRSVLAYGIETAYNTVTSSAGQVNVFTGQKSYAESRYPSGFNNLLTGSVYGCFTTIWNPTVTSVAGARYTRSYLHSLQEDTMYQSPEREAKINTGAPSGCLGIIIQPIDFWQLTLNGSTGFRAPNVDDMNRLFKSVRGRGYIMVPNNGLQPEYAYSIDFGNRVSLGNTLSIQAKLFATLVENLMEEDDFTYKENNTEHNTIIYSGRPNQVRSLVNKGSANITGSNVNVHLRFSSGFSLKNTVTFMTGKANRHQPLRSIPPLFGTSHVLFKLYRVKGDFFVRYNGKKSEDLQSTAMVFNDDGSLLYPLNSDGVYFSPAWYTLNLVTTTILNKYLDCNLGVENILNKCYHPYANGMAAPGVNIVVSVTGKI